jgi:hypothetical protein
MPAWVDVPPAKLTANDTAATSASTSNATVMIAVRDQPLIGGDAVIVLISVLLSSGPALTGFRAASVRPKGRNHRHPDHTVRVFSVTV